MEFTYSSKEITELHIKYVKKRVISVSKTKGERTVTAAVALEMGQPCFYEVLEEKINEIIKHETNK